MPGEIMGRHDFHAAHACSPGSDYMIDRDPSTADERSERVRTLEHKGTPASIRTLTIRDVARLAGVSPITVSRVINHPELVMERTRDAVRLVIDQTGYVPNMLAGALSSARSRLVAAIVPSVTNLIFLETVQALTDRLRRAGYQTFFGFSGYPGTREDELILAALSRRPDGIFLTGVRHARKTRERLLAARVPIVETWDLTKAPLDMLVGFSHERVGAVVATRLLQLGYKRFYVVTADDERALRRRRAFESTLRRHGITDVQAVEVPAPSTFALGREAMAHLLSTGFHSGVIFCSSDTLAHGVLTEAQSRRLAVPGRVSIVGFGDLEYAAHTAPALSTVRIDRVGIGVRAADALLASMSGEPARDKVIDLGFEFVERGTTCQQ